MRLEPTIRPFLSAALALSWVGAVGACSGDNAASPPKDGGGDATLDGGATEAMADGGIADAPADAADVGAESDGPLEAEAGPCIGVVCADACLQATDCRTCTGAPLLCGATGTCV